MVSSGSLPDPLIARTQDDVTGLVEVLKKSENPAHRRDAAFFLGGIGTQCYNGYGSHISEVDLVGAEEALTAALDDPDDAVRKSVAAALPELQKGIAAHRGGTYEAEQKADLDEKRAESLRATAYQAGMAYTGSGRVSNFLAAELKDELLEGLGGEDAVTRRWAAVALGSFRDDQQVGSALGPALKDRDANVRDCAAFSLAEVMGEEARGPLQMALAGETSDYIRDRIRAALNRIGGRSS